MKREAPNKNDGAAIKRKREAEIRQYFYAQRVLHEKSDSCGRTCSIHSWPGTTGPGMCPYCLEAYRARMALLECLGLWSSRVNQLIGALFTKYPESRFPLYVEPSGVPTIRECKKFLKRFANRNGIVHGYYAGLAPPSPYAPGDFDSWSIVVRAYEETWA